MLKRLYIILENYNYPELKSFLVDIRMAQIEIVPYVPADLEAGESYGVSDGRQEAVPGMVPDDPGCSTFQ